MAQFRLLCLDWSGVQSETLGLSGDFHTAESLNFGTRMLCLIKVLLTVMKYFQWAHAGVISSDEDIWVHTAYRVASALRSRGLPVGVVLTTGQDSQSIQKALQQIRQADRIRSECFLGAQLSMWLQ